MKTLNTIFIASVLTLPLNSLAEITGKVNYETSAYVNEEDISNGGISRYSSDLFKNQIEFKLYVDEEIDDSTNYHLELNLNSDSKGVEGGYRQHQSYTQRDPIREAYIDSEKEDWSLRIGKQQVVWGTADGIKLLDLINPTDYSEMVQNSPEDARIPVWMLNAEQDLVDGSNFQIIVSESRENIFAGLNRNINTSVRSNGMPNYRGIPDVAGIGHNQGHSFILKGVDTITGQKNGFLNIAPDLGSVAAGFGAGFVSLFNQQGGVNLQGGVNGLNAIAPPDADARTIGGVNGYNALLSNFTVGKFTSGYTLAQLDGGFRQAQVDNGLSQTGDLSGTAGFANTYFGLNIANQACQDSQYNSAQNSIGQNACTALSQQFNASGKITGSQTIVAQQTAIIFNQVSTDTLGVGTALTGADVLDGFGAQYDSNLSTFADGKRDSAFEYMTGASFRTFDTFVNARSQYVYNKPNSEDVNVAFRFKNSLSNGLNYSYNYSYNYDANPVINLSWRNDAGDELNKTVTDISSISRDALGATYTSTAQYISLADEEGKKYGGSYATAAGNEAYGAVIAASGTMAQAQAAYGAAAGARSAILTFEQTLKRAHNIGGSLDYAIDTKDFGAVVLRAEALYQIDVYSPIIDLNKLSIGDLTDALKMTPGDKFKYVLGIDITILTNMLVSTQFIQERNLDFVDINGKYTADFASMHLTNGLLKAQDDKEFYSLFLSKPFGSSGQHRWNNIIIYEDQGSGGYWNRLDVELSVTDNMQLTGELNKYWGEIDSQFGQLINASNLQIGFKYNF